MKELGEREREKEREEGGGGGVEETDFGEEMEIYERLKQLRKYHDVDPEWKEEWVRNMPDVQGEENYEFGRERVEDLSEMMDIRGNEKREIFASEKGLTARVRDVEERENSLDNVFRSEKTGKKLLFRSYFGPNSKKLIKSLVTKYRKKKGSATSEKRIGLMFVDSDGKARTVIVKNSKGERETKDKRVLGSKTYREFKNLVKEAEKEYGNTNFGYVYEKLQDLDPENAELTPKMMDEISDRTNRALELKSRTLTEKIEKVYKDSTSDDAEKRKRGVNLTKEEEREIHAMISGHTVLDLDVHGNPLEVPKTPEEKVRDLTIEISEWVKRYNAEKPDDMPENTEEEKKAKEESKRRKTFFGNLANNGRIQREMVRLRDGLRPGGKEGIEEYDKNIENNDQGRLERFRRFLNRHTGGIAVVGVLFSVTFAVAGFVVDLKKKTWDGLNKMADIVKDFGKSTGNFLKKLGSFFAGVAPVAYTLTNLLSYGLLFIAKFLWIFLAVLAFAFYELFKRVRERKKRKISDE